MSIDIVPVRGVRLPGLGQVVNPQHVASVIAERSPHMGEWRVVIRMAFGRDFLAGDGMNESGALALRDKVAGAIFLDNITDVNYFPPAPRA